MPTKYKGPHGWVDCVAMFIQVVKLRNKIQIVPVGAVVGPAHFGGENAAWDSIDSVLLVQKHVDLDTNWTLDQVTMSPSRYVGEW